MSVAPRQRGAWIETVALRRECLELSGIAPRQRGATIETLNPAEAVRRRLRHPSQGSLLGFLILVSGGWRVGYLCR